MSGLNIKIDAAGIAAQFKELALEVEQDLQKGVANLAAITHAKVAEMANSELKTSRKTLTDNLGFEQISPGVWVVSIDEKAMWIEEGIDSNHDMKPDLLKNATKVSKDGHRYRSIPFDHSAPPSQLTPTANHIVGMLKESLKKEKIPFKKIERNEDGTPKLGRIHSKNFGGPIPGKGNTPVLQGVNIYQSITKSGNVRRDILTFRTVSDGPGSQGKWIHPGKEPKHFLERAEEWAMKTWEDQILPEILAKYSKK